MLLKRLECQYHVTKNMILTNPNMPNISDFEMHPVWREKPLGKYIPETTLPVDDLSDCLIGANVVLSNGAEIFSILSNICNNSPLVTSLTIQIIVFKENEMFYLDRGRKLLRPAESLANFLELDVNDVFPIRYDVTKYSTGDPNSLIGEIWSDLPPISEEERMRIILDDLMKSRKE